ncbi:MAG: arginase [Chloroflexi bacterium]|nr:arginase [Chloroflexota bacterium]
MSLSKPTTIRIYGVPLDLGQQRRGVDMGPSALRYAELQKRLEQLGLTVCDGGNIVVPVAEQVDHQAVDGRAHNATAIGAVCRVIYDHMRAVIAAGEIGIFLGGDHSVSIGTVAAVLEHPLPVGVLWIDAHGDFNTPQTTISGNVHGMVVSALMGSGPEVLTIGARRLQPQQIVMIGTRDLDLEERVKLAESGIKVFTMRDIDENGMATVVQAALTALGNVSVLHVSLDMDSLDPQFAPGVGTPAPGGLTYREAHLLMEMLADDGRVRSLDIVEVNPILGGENHTAEVAVELAASLFGQRIL